MDLTINHSCPSCGGPVEMSEADRLTVCPYCEVQNYMVGGGMLRFVLPDDVPGHIHRESIFYFPYLRFKGNIYTCIGTKVGSKVLDTTHQGIESRRLPPSLGLRPQAMNIVMATDTIAGQFIKRAATPAAVLQRAEKLARSVIDSAEDQLYHRAFIGESVSCLYLPIYIENGKVHDGVLNRVLGSAEEWLADSRNLMGFRKEWQPAFLAMICPRCGDAMQGEANSLIVTCFNCDSCWSEEKGRFRQLNFKLIEGGRGMKYLPFWRLKVETEGLEIKSFGDLLKVTNQSIVVSQAHRRRPLEFWIPAIKIRPKVFLTMAKAATLSQFKYPEGRQTLDKALEPATLPVKEAVQAIKSVFAETSVNKRDVMPRLADLSFSVQESVLSYLPFEDNGHDLVQKHSSLSVAASVIRTGRRL